MFVKKGWAESWSFILLVIGLISFPLFFDIYRKVAFNTSPRDDYAPLLLWFVSTRGSWLPSPAGYRVLSVLPAVPLYWLLPLYKFSLLPKTDLANLKAIEALAFLSFLATAGSATVAFKIARNRIGRDIGEASLAAMLTLVLANFDGIEGADPIALFLVFVLVYCFEQRQVFCSLFALVPFTNEKIIFFFFFLVLGRSMLGNDFLRSHLWQIGATLVGLAIYLIMIRVIGLPGNEGQTQLARRLPLLVSGTQLSILSLKGFVRNLLPTVIFSVPCIWFALRRPETNGLLRASDVIVPLGMLLVGLSFTEPVQFQVGRIVAYAMPLTVIAILSLIKERDQVEWASQSFGQSSLRANQHRRTSNIS